MQNVEGLWGNILTPLIRPIPAMAKGHRLKYTEIYVAPERTGALEVMVAQCWRVKGYTSTQAGFKVLLEK